MEPSRVPEVKKDMLRLTSTVQQILRAMYLHRSDYLLAQSLTRERLFHKEQLVALMEQGGERTTLDELFTSSLKEPVSAKMRLEEVPKVSPLLLFVQSGGGDGETSLTTFGAYRERKLNENTIIMPDWWGIPLPLVYIDEDRVLLNNAGSDLVPGGAVAMARHIHKMTATRFLTLRDGAVERTFSLTPLGSSTYFIEDVSGDYEMAEDLKWWAAVGRAFVSRMQNNGVDVGRLSPLEAIPSDAAEIIECKWEGEVVGRLVLKLPQAQKQQPAQGAAPAPAQPQTKKPTAQTRPAEQKPQPKPAEKIPQAETSAKEQPKPQAAKPARSVPARPAEQTQKAAAPQAARPKPKPKTPDAARPAAHPQGSASAAAGEKQNEKPGPKPAAQTTPTGEPKKTEVKKETPPPAKQEEKVAEEPKAPPTPVEEETIGSIDDLGEQENLRRSAAKNAYGIKTQSEAAKAAEQAEDIAAPPADAPKADDAAKTDERPAASEPEKAEEVPPPDSTDVDKVKRIREANAPQAGSE